MDPTAALNVLTDALARCRDEDKRIVEALQPWMLSPQMPLHNFGERWTATTLPGRNQSLRQRRPGVLLTNRVVMSALPNVPRTIPIEYGRCFTHRFSPTGFILNASDLNCCRPIVLGSHSG
jgi:hypothetical protein